MGRTCWQSGSFSRAVLIQFTKANLSSSEAADTQPWTHSSVSQVTQHGVILDVLFDSVCGGSKLSASRLPTFWFLTFSNNFWVCWTVRDGWEREIINSFYHTRERVLCAFAWKLWCPSDGQDAFFSVEDCPECLCYLTAPQLLDYLEEKKQTPYESQICLSHPVKKKHKKKIEGYLFHATIQGIDFFLNIGYFLLTKRKRNYSQFLSSLWISSGFFTPLRWLTEYFWLADKLRHAGSLIMKMIITGKTFIAGNRERWVCIQVSI